MKLLTALFTATLLLPMLSSAREAGPAAACKADAAKLCSGIQPGGGRVAACLKEKTDQLTPGCKAAITQMADCAEQAKKICGDAAQAEGGLRECVRKNAAQFSASCKGK